MSIRYQAVSSGSMWRVIERTSGKTLAFRRCYQCALQYASNLEQLDAGDTAAPAAA